MRHFTRRDVAAQFHRSFSRGYADDRYEIEDIALVLDLCAPVWVVSYWLIAGKGPHAVKYHSKALFFERARPGVSPFLALCEEQRVPENCVTPADEDLALHAQSGGAR